MPCPASLRKCCAIALVVLTGCGSFASRNEAAFLKKGRELAAAQDYPRALLEFRNAARVAPRDAEPYYEIGLTHLRAGDPRPAVQAFRRALELNPKHEGARTKIALLMSSSARPETLSRAANQLREIVEQSPENTEAADALAMAEWRLGDREEAIERLEKQLNALPASLSSSVMLARMKLAGQDWKAAEEVLRRAVASAPESSDASLALGEMYLVTRQIALAEPRIRRAIELNPGNGQALMALAAIQTAAKNWDAAGQTYGRLSALGGRQYRSLHALFLWELGKKEQAIAELRELVRRDPADRMARTRLIAALLAAGNRPAAQKLVSDALSRNPKDTDALLERAGLELGRGNASGAQKDLAQVLQYHPDSAEAHAAMASVDRALGQPLSERQELIQAVNLRGDLLPARLALARKYVRAGEPKAALEAIGQAPAAQQGLAPVAIERNWALLVIGDVQGLKASLAVALRGGRRSDLIVQEALMHMAAGEYPAARARAIEVWEHDARDARAVRVVAESYAAEKQAAKGLAWLGEAARKHPESAPVQYTLGLWEAAAGDPAHAREHFQAAARADAGFAGAQIGLADLDRRQNRVDAARQRVAAILERSPRDVNALLLAAEIEKQSGNRALAVERYRAVLSIDPVNVVALNNIAGELTGADPDSALEYARRAQEIAPQNAAVSDTLGWIYYRKGMYSAAVRYLKSSVEAEPNPRRQYHLALCYLKSGEPRLGQELLRAAIQKDPNIEGAADGRTR
jgi:tetratricopeptide (TPR) repeat protein